MPTPYSPAGGSVKPSWRALAREELVRNLNGQPRAVARLRIAAAGAAMGQVDEDLNPLQHDVVRFLPLDVDDKAHAASVALIWRVV